MPDFHFSAPCGLDKVFEDISRSEADDKTATHAEFCTECDGKDDVTVSTTIPAETDGGTATGEVVEQHPGPGRTDDDMEGTDEAESVEELPHNEPAEQLPENPSVEEDPLDWVLSHFVDDIQGVSTINRKGYAVLAANYGVSVTAEPITLPSENEFEYAQFRAIAKTEDGQEYSGFGSAHVDRDDDKHLLAELAETRALKRACAWATGVGLTAVEELRGDVQ